MLSLRFTPEAEREYLAAIDYAAAEYGQAVAGQLILLFESAVNFLCSHPESAPIIDAPYRCRSLVRFPYGIIYRFDDHAVYVVAVAHQKRHPEYWKDRRGD